MQPTTPGKTRPNGGATKELPTELIQARRFGKTRSAQSTALFEDYVELIADLLTSSGEARPTDIARRLGVSHATAIKAISRRPERCRSRCASMTSTAVCSPSYAAPAQDCGRPLPVLGKLRRDRLPLAAGATPRRRCTSLAGFGLAMNKVVRNGPASPQDFGAEAFDRFGHNLRRHVELAGGSARLSPTILRAIASRPFSVRGALFSVSIRFSANSRCLATPEFPVRVEWKGS
jgi:hypothetical protein